MSGFSASFDRLIAELEKMPGIGRKSAQRLAFHILRSPESDVSALAASLLESRKNIRACSVCFSITESDPCGICSDTRRDGTVLCVVEQPSDVLAIERAQDYKGRYHVLEGVISPLDGVSPEDLRIRELLDRVAKGEIAEVIIATNPSLEGEATAMYVGKLVKPLGPKVTRIARGLPAGGDLEYADQVTLSRAMEGRREL